MALRFGTRALGALAAAMIGTLTVCSSDDAQGPPSTSTTSGSGGEAGAGGSAPSGPHLVIPAVIDLPYVVAGQGGSTASVIVENDGDAPFTMLDFKLSGDASLGLVDAPEALDAGQKATLTVSYEGSPVEAIASATLAVALPDGSLSVPVFAVAGDPGLGGSDWVGVEGPGGITLGEGTTVSMPFAPYPDGSGSFDDSSVHVFLPAGYREIDAQDMVLHFHGWNTTLDATLTSHHYREHVYASGVNAVLVVPQGPVGAPSGDFGKLMSPGGVAALLQEVLVLLYREGKISHPMLGDMVLTSHSGGYQAVALNLMEDNLAPPAAQVDLYDSLYGYESTYESYAIGGGILRSNYTSGGGTLDNNEGLAASLSAQGSPPAEQATQEALRDDPAVITFADTTHAGSTRIDGIYGEALRWKMRHSRRGPRIELRQAASAGSEAVVRWFAPFDDDVTGFVVETSADGSAWQAAASAGPNDEEAHFPLNGGVRVRVRSIVRGLDDTLPSDVYRVDPAPKVLVVDGFDRLVDGSFGGLSHDFAALVGESAGAVATISNEAVTEGGFDLSGWPVVLWLLGDESTGDHSLSADEQQILLDYVDAGGSLIVSGSEAAWDLAKTAEGDFFLAHCFGAQYLADDSGSYVASGVGAFGDLPSFTYAGPGAPYDEDSPDALSAGVSGEVLLEYGSGQAAAVGVPHKGALVGFPLELVDDEAARDLMVERLLSYVQ